MVDINDLANLIRLPADMLPPVGTTVDKTERQQAPRKFARRGGVKDATSGVAVADKKLVTGLQISICSMGAGQGQDGKQEKKGESRSDRSGPIEMLHKRISEMLSMQRGNRLSVGQFSVRPALR